jgi:hypothetical protein
MQFPPKKETKKKEQKKIKRQENEIIKTTTRCNEWMANAYQMKQAQRNEKITTKILWVKLASNETEMKRHCTFIQLLHTT